MTKITASSQERIDRLSTNGAELLNLLIDKKFGKTEEIKPYPRARRNGEARVPTSWAQQRLWFISQLEGASEGYQIPVAFRLRGTLDEEALRKALDTLVLRHEVLRTVIGFSGDDPMQEIADDGRFALKVIDLRSYGDADREEKIWLQKTEEAHGKFELAVGPLVRGRLLRLQDEEHLLLVTMHHIICDGWSMGVFFRELSELYRAYREGRSNPLEPLPIQYADYAQWQRQWLRGTVLNRQLRYWRAHLDGVAPHLELPTDRPRPAIQRFRGARMGMVLDAQLIAKLKGLAQRYEMTLFMVLYAGWAILLARISGQDDVVIGTPVSNRQRPEFERLIGFFVNTLVLRLRVRGDLKLDELLQQVKELTLAAYDNQDVPFEQLVEALQPQRSLSRNPLFQVMLALQNAPSSDLRLGGLAVNAEDDVYEASKFDLLLSLEERGDEVVGSMSYATDIFDRGTIGRWMQSFITLLSGMADHIRNPIGELPILPEHQFHQLSSEFNAMVSVYPKEKLIHELFEDQVSRTPGAVATVYEQQSLTYAELNGRANQLARYLRGKHVGSDEVVALCIDRGPEMVVGLLGILKAGAAYLPLDPNHPSERLHYILQDAAPRVILTQNKLMARLPSTQIMAITLDASWNEIAEYSEENLTDVGLRPNAQNLVYVIYTSGSTGRPKGTAMAHYSLVNLIAWHRRTFGGGEGRNVLQFAALSFDVAFQEIFSTLCSGSTLVLIDEWTRRDARALAEVLCRYSVERLFVPPLMLQGLAEHLTSADAPPVLCLKDVITAGEQLLISPEISRLFERLDGCRLHNHYGPTEAHVVTTNTLPGNSSEWDILPVIGRPISNTQMYVLDGRLQLVPIGVVGELYIAGAGVARGYLRRPELTAERFLADPFNSDAKSRLYKTGDLGRWRTDGTLQYLGRNDDQVKVRGFRIELGEIEGQLARHEQVRDVAVVARKDVAGEMRIVAYLTNHPQGELSAEDLRTYLSRVLPDYMVPSAFVVLRSLPMTPNGKVDKRALPTPELGGYSQGGYEAAEGDVEKALAVIWQELLQVERVGRRDNFFELGGHSLHGMKLVAKVGARFNVHLAVTAVFQYPTLQQLAKVVESSLAGAEQARSTKGIEFEEGVI